MHQNVPLWEGKKMFPCRAIYSCKIRYIQKTAFSPSKKKIVNQFTFIVSLYNTIQ